MTYDQWFISQQGTPYEGSYQFAEAAWVHQLTRIIDQQDTIKQIREDLVETRAQRDELLSALTGLVAWADDLRRTDPVEDLRKARAALANCKECQQ